VEGESGMSLEHHLQIHFSWIAVLLMIAVLAATIAFGAHLSNKLDRIEEGLIHNGEGLDRIAEMLSQNAPQTTPPQR